MGRMIDVLIFFFLIVVVYALVGTIIIGDLDGPDSYDPVSF